MEALETCALCHLEKPAVEFYRTKDMNPRTKSKYCRSCRKYIRNGAPTRNKVCPGCGQDLSFYNFEPRDGRLTDLCNTCAQTLKLCRACKKALPLEQFTEIGSQGRGKVLRSALCDACKEDPAYKTGKGLSHERISRPESGEKIQPAAPASYYSAKAVMDQNKRRANYRGLRNDLTMVEWKFLIDQANNHCLACGNEFDKTESGFPTMDHVFTGIDGLIDGLTLRNTQPVCNACNASKRDRTNADYRPLEMRRNILSRIRDRGNMNGDELEMTEQLLLTGTFDPIKLNPMENKK